MRNTYAETHAILLRTQDWRTYTQILSLEIIKGGVDLQWSVESKTSKPIQHLVKSVHHRKWGWGGGGGAGQ